MRKQSSEADSRRRILAAEVSAQQQHSQELQEQMQSARAMAERHTSTTTQPAQATDVASTRRAMLEKMLEERTQSLSRVKAELAEATGEADEAQQKVGAMTQEVRERLAEETSKAEDDAKQWKARAGQLERELAIAKDHETSVHQQSESTKVEGSRSNGGDATVDAAIGGILRVSTAEQPSQPPSLADPAQMSLSSMNGHPISTSAAGAGHSRFATRGSTGRSRGGDTSCQQQ